MLWLFVVWVVVVVLTTAVASLSFYYYYYYCIAIMERRMEGQTRGDSQRAECLKLKPRQKLRRKNREKIFSW